MSITKRNGTIAKPAALFAASLLIVPAMLGCGMGGNNQSGAQLPPVDDTRGSASQGYNPGYNNNPQEKRGMSTGTKVAILAGAAALYYMYKKNKEKHAQGVATSEPVYYLSKNGRVYYRDAQGRAHWVTPPAQGIQVPAEEAYQYRDFQGYNNRTDGRTLADLAGY